MEQLERFSGFLPARHGQNLALTVLHVPYLRELVHAEAAEGYHRRALGLLQQACPLTPNTVELIPTLGALLPRGGPVLDPVLNPPLTELIISRLMIQEMRVEGSMGPRI